tara:strand:- start:117 stop:533 length:417 start_codon:yes stop_codon:yes gene_type:complete
MKLTKSQLKQIIKEELELLVEQPGLGDFMQQQRSLAYSGQEKSPEWLAKEAGNKEMADELEGLAKANPSVLQIFNRDPDLAIRTMRSRIEGNMLNDAGQAKTRWYYAKIKGALSGDPKSLEDIKSALYTGKIPPGALD